MSSEAGEQIKKSICVWCKGECGVLVYVKDEHLVKVEEDPVFPRKVYPATSGCVRRRAAREWFYHPDKVNFPLKRAGKKGEGKWQQIPWEQALDEIAQQLSKIKANYGAEGIAYSGGTGYRFETHFRERFFRLLGSANIASQAQICFLPRSRIAEAIVGWFPHYSIKPVTKCIVSLGMETLVSRPITAKLFLDAKKQGAKLIVIDPRRTTSASMADVWLPLRPGTDCALLMGMINVIIEEELYDKEFVERWCYGFDKLKERAKEYSLERVESITHVPADKIREAARVYALNRPGCFVEGMGVEHLENNAEILHARWILAGLTGNVDVEGGEELVGHNPQVTAFRKVGPRVEVSADQFAKQIGADRFRLFGSKGAQLVTENMERVWNRPPLVSGLAHAPSIYRAMITGKPYPVRAMWTSASNPMVTQGNTQLVYEALKSLDLYVVVDYWMTPSAELADYVLPPTCWLQRPILTDFGGYARFLVAGEAALPSVIPGEYDHKGDYEILRELGIRLGQGEEYWPWKSLEEYYDSVLEPTGYTHDEYVHKVRCEPKPVKYKKYEEIGFATPTGKVELYSTIFEKLGYDPLPRYREPAETQISNPELAKEYPFTLITGGRVREFYHSDWHQIESVRKRHPNPLVQIHPDTAGKLDINHGDWVWIETPRGRAKQKAELFDGMSPNIIHAEHAWSLPELPGKEPQLHGVFDVNINMVTDDDPEVCNPITGSWPLRTALCKIYKV